MKKLPHAFRFILILLLGILLIFACTRINNAPIQKGLSAAAFHAQTTVTPPVEDKSEIGSTDGIAIIGIIIVIIVVVPILLQRKNWSKD